MNRAAELRAAAKRLRAEADSIYEKYKAPDAGEFPADELRSYDEKVAAAAEKIAEAEAWEKREKDRNDFDARVRKAEERAANPNDAADDFEKEVARRPYSLIRAAMQFAKRQEIDGWEKEVSDEYAKRFNRPAQGFYLPLNLPFTEAERRAAGDIETRADLDTTAGAGAIATIKPDSLIELLRNRTVLGRMGARMLPDLVGIMSLPKQTAAATASWVAQGSAPGATALTIGTVDLTPKTVAARTLITRRMQLQPTLGIEMIAREDLISQIGIAVDTAAINGTVADPQLSPIGLLNRSGVSLALGSGGLGATGGALTWAGLVALESAIYTANADAPGMAYLTNAKVRGHAKQKAKIGSTFPSWLMEADGTMNGYPTFISNCVPSNLEKSTSGTILSALLFGVWSELLIGMWSAVDILSDPYTSGGSGGLNLYALQDLDVNTRHDESFAKLVDVNAAA